MKLKNELKGLSDLILEIPTLESSVEGQLKGGFYAVANIGISISGNQEKLLLRHFL